MYHVAIYGDDGYPDGPGSCIGMSTNRRMPHTPSTPFALHPLLEQRMTRASVCGSSCSDAGYQNRTCTCVGTVMLCVPSCCTLHTRTCTPTSCEDGGSWSTCHGSVMLCVPSCCTLHTRTSTSTSCENGSSWSTCHGSSWSNDVHVGETDMILRQLHDQRQLYDQRQRHDQLHDQRQLLP